MSSSINSTTAWPARRFPNSRTGALGLPDTASNTADRAINLNVQKLAWQIATQDPESEYLVVFNPHAWPVTIPSDPISIGPTTNRRGLTTAGAEPSHTSGPRLHRHPIRSKLVFQADLPAFVTVSTASARQRLKLPHPRRSPRRNVRSKTICSASPFATMAVWRSSTRRRNGKFSARAHPGARGVVIDDPESGHMESQCNGLHE